MSLELGPQPGDLIVHMVTGDEFSASLVLDEDGTTIAWPSAPDLEFATGFTVTATLSEEVGSTVDSMATWTLTEAEVAAIPNRTKVRLAVDGETWFLGGTRCQS